MPTDVGRQLTGTAVGMGIGRGLGELGIRSPVPLPSFYNAGSDHPWRDSQARRMLQGDRRAWAGYGRGVADRAIGGAIAGPIGAMVAPWVDRHIVMPAWQGIKDIFHRDAPTGTVTVGDLNDTSGFDNQQIDPWTGERVTMPSFSNYGPYASGYQGLGGDSHQNEYPEFTDYSSDSGPEYEGPYSPEHYGLEAPMPSFGAGNHFSYSQAGGGSGAGLWDGGGGMRSFVVNTGSLNSSNYSGIDSGQGRKKGTSPRN